MVPSMMEELLFDDILFRDIAYEEHATFRAVLACFAREVLDVQDLLAESLAEEQARTTFVDGLLELTLGDTALREELLSMDAATLARTVVEGRERPPDHGGIGHYALNPVPNLLFMRDPAFAIGSGVVLSSMARASRMRESYIMGQIFGAAPRFATTPILLDALRPGSHRGAGPATPTIEGGDVLVPDPSTVLAGLSERTSLAGVDLLARALASEGRVKSLIVVALPQDRYTMHLDTVFTFVDRGHALVFPPFFEPRKGTIRVRRVELTGDVATNGLPPLSFDQELLDALRAAGAEVEPIPIGGARLIDQLREQWTDGCNSLCLAPGRILLYKRNFHTLETLATHGFRVVDASQFLARRDYYLRGAHRLVIGLDASELSRARGGPRCMSMPLRRAGR